MPSSPWGQRKNLLQISWIWVCACKKDQRSNIKWVSQEKQSKAICSIMYLLSFTPSAANSLFWGIEIKNPQFEDSGRFMITKMSLPFSNWIAFKGCWKCHLLPCLKKGVISSKLFKNLQAFQLIVFYNERTNLIIKESDLKYTDLMTSWGIPIHSSFSFIVTTMQVWSETIVWCNYHAE